MTDADNPETNLANAGIEYGGWGLLLLFVCKRCLTIARTNGIRAAFGSPCALSCEIDTNPGHPPADGARTELEMVKAQPVMELDSGDEDDSV